MLGKSTLQSAFAHWKGITRASKEGLEVWAPVGESHYLVSTFGNVKNGKTGLVLKGSINPHGYAAVCLRIVTGKNTITRVHRLVAAAFLTNNGCKPSVDHIDTDKLNNHVSNLRYASHSENQMNKDVQKNNTSGVAGVWFETRGLKWCAQIKVDSKRKHLGYFETKDEAIAARVKASNELFGEFTHSSQKVS